MKIYILSQNQYSSYDTYDSCVVCAESEEDAKTIHPEDCDINIKDHWMHVWADSVENVRCEEIGIANDKQKRGVICASFNAG
jgi:hypothetical protein